MRYASQAGSCLSSSGRGRTYFQGWQGLAGVRWRDGRRREQCRSEQQIPSRVLLHGDGSAEATLYGPSRSIRQTTNGVTLHLTREFPHHINFTE